MAPRIKLHVHQGQRFGRGVVVEEFRRGGRMVRMRCDCGTTYEASISDVFRGDTVSCGCARTERIVALTRASSERGTHPAIKHGLYQHPHYQRWKTMLARCYRPGAKDYKHYGGRGIEVDPAWHDVAAFVAYVEAELGPKPPGHTLDRIDNEGNYEPGNVRWADARTQLANRRRSVR